MELAGEQRIPAPRAAVWGALNDPEILKKCIAGCQSLTKTGDNSFSAVVQAKVGPVSAKFNGRVTLADLDPPNSYTLSGEGQGGVAGFGKGSAKVKLSDDGGVTVLTYAATAQVGGKLAQIGSRLVDGAAAKMAEDFFTRFNEIVAAQSAPAGVASVAPPPAPAAPKTGLSAPVWIGATVLAVAIVLGLVLYFG